VRERHVCAVASPSMGRRLLVHLQSGGACVGTKRHHSPGKALLREQQRGCCTGVERPER
jgi:hypothetical protein